MADADPPQDGYFYHSIDLPDHGTVTGAWDLRSNTEAYVGRIALAGKRVLEVGAANGFISLFLEKQGADVVPFDLSPEHLGDIMPCPGIDNDAFVAGYRRVVAGLNKAWWYCHDAYSSRLSLRHGSVYALPSDIGEVDVTFFGSVLLHLRDPQAALQQAARVTRERIVVTDVFEPPFRVLPTLTDRVTQAIHPQPLSVARDWGLIFNPTANSDPCVWWFFSPGGMQRLLKSVGFHKFEVSFHEQDHFPAFAPWGTERPKGTVPEPVKAHLFTVIAERG